MTKEVFIRKLLAGTMIVLGIIFLTSGLYSLFSRPVAEVAGGIYLLTLGTYFAIIRK
jgi:uncharacterized membrane-anchored protein